MSLIEENLSCNVGTFYEKLTEEGYFDHSLFAELIIYIDKANQSEITRFERLEKAVRIWELGYRIQSSIGFNFDPDDMFEIENVPNEKLAEISQAIDYLCKSFTEEITIDLDFIRELTQ